MNLSFRQGLAKLPFQTLNVVFLSKASKQWACAPCPATATKGSCKGQSGVTEAPRGLSSQQRKPSMQSSQCRSHCSNQVSLHFQGRCWALYSACPHRDNPPDHSSPQCAHSHREPSCSQHWTCDEWRRGPTSLLSLESLVPRGSNVHWTNLSIAGHRCWTHAGAGAWAQNRACPVREGLAGGWHSGL